MSDNEIEDVSFLPGESLHRKARYEPNILQKFKLVACSKGRATAMAVLLGVFILVVVLIAVLAHGTSSCDKPLAVKATTTPNIVQDYISTNGKPFPYRDIRLPKAIIPSKYKLFMHPNISASFFVGTVNITCKVAEVTNFIVFHIKELNITELTVTEVESGVPVPVVEYYEYKANEEVYVQLGTKLVVNKNVEISVGFRGDLVKKLAGFYKSTYKTDNGEERHIATTHFEPTDARAAFPCFDEPELKATFQLTMVREKDLTALFNMPIKETMSHGSDGLVKDVFQESVKMSTYLVAFVVCDYGNLTSHTTRNTKVGVYAPKDKIATAKFALDAAVKILDYYEQFFKVPYPLPKQDLIAIPDFAAGAMENWGLITYRMTAILYDPAVSSTSDKEWVAVVVAHELAHQWFGNLVTMAWWDDLWLNEGFASYMEYDGSDKIVPEYQMHDQFVLDAISRALYLDSLTNSHPISVKVHNPDEINEIFDSISYKKGASIIRMLKNFLGEETFKSGLTSYLNKYKYDNAATKDLWDSFTEAVQTGSQSTTNVSKLMDTWTLQMGYPVITLKREGKHVTATQDRFLLYPNTNISSEFTSPYGYQWQVPFIYSVSSTPQKGERLLITEDKVTFDIPETSNWVKGNSGMFGYYRVNYDPDNWNRLIAQLNKKDHTIFSTSERAGLIDDAFMLARAGLLDEQVALGLTEYMVHEKDYLPWRSCLDNFAYIEDRIETKPVYTQYKKYLFKLMKNLLDVTTWEDTGTPLKKFLRSAILGKAVRFGHGNSIKNGKRLFEQWKSNHSSISPNLKNVIYMAGIRYGEESDWELMWEQYLRETDATEKGKLLRALGQTRDSNLLARLLDYGLNETKIRSQDTPSVVSSVTSNPAGSILAWRFFQKNWDLFYKRYGTTSFMMPRLISVTAGHFDTKFDLEQVDSFFSERDAGSGKRAVQQVKEKIQMNIDWLDKYERSITKWLEDHA